MKSLRRQLTRELLLALALLLGAALLLIYGFMWWQLNRAFNSALEARALGISGLVELEDGHLKIDPSEKLLRGFTSEKARRYFELRDTHGVLIARSASLTDRHLESPPGPATEKSVYWDLTLPNGRDGRAVRFLFQPKPANESAASVPINVDLIVAVDREDLDENLGGLFFAVAGCGGLLFLVVLFVVPRVLRRGLAPVDRLAEQVTRIDAGTLGERFATGSLPDELRPITERLNDLLARLETSFERERRFSADLAHELRTPLAELRSLAECALKWPEAREPGADRDVLAIALQMEALVTRLLTLVRGERGQLAVQSEPVDLAAIVTAAWRPFATRAVARGLRVEITAAPAASPADPVLLHSILNNLFDNAVDYTPQGGEIAVGVTREGICVANTAGVLVSDDVARLFERFWRKEAARSGGEHVGLGLSLARAFAAAMDWRLEAALESDRLVFRLTPAPAGTVSTAL